MTGPGKKESTADVTDCRGVAVSYANTGAVAALEQAHQAFLSFYGDPLAEISLVIEEHPGFILAHLFKAACLTQLMEIRALEDLVGAVESAEALSPTANERELAHLAAVRAWITGDYFAAVANWEKALDANPHDLLALQLIHLTNVLFGDIVGQRDVVAGVYNLWHESIHGFEFVLGFYAFGLEENGDYERAEAMGRHSLKLLAENPYAIHAIVHIMEMQGRQAEGLRFMYERIGLWTESDFAIHLWWHTALLHLDLQEVDRVLEIYDEHLCSAVQDSSRYEEFDATALLWRLKLIGVDVGGRWCDLADKWEPAAQDTLYVFNDIKAMMAFVSDNREEAAHSLLAANENYVRHSAGVNVAVTRQVGLPIYSALLDFHCERYTECVDYLLPIRHQTDCLGGSRAQRDIIGWTLLEAAIRSARYDLALALANERCELKPTSPQHWFNLARVLDGQGKDDLAQESRAKATALISR